eukprot:3938216-Rhodomonas_salina.1
MTWERGGERREGVTGGAAREVEREQPGKVMRASTSARNSCHAAAHCVLPAMSSRSELGRVQIGRPTSRWESTISECYTAESMGCLLSRSNHPSI